MKARFKLEEPPEPEWYPVVFRSKPVIIHTFEQALADYEKRKAEGKLRYILHMEATNPRDEGGMQSGGERSYDK